MQDFMMPVQPGMAGELPPGIPQQPVGVVPAPVTQAAPTAPLAAVSPAPSAVTPAGDYQQLLMDEGANGDTPGGMGFFDKIRSDPKMAQAMLMAGTRMMQGNKAGQDDLGMLGDAMMAGATAHNMLSYNEKQNALKQQELDMKQRESAARLGQLEQETKFKEELQPMEVAKARELIAKYKTENKSAEAKALGDAIRNDPEMVRRTLDDQHNVSRANVNQSNAASASSGALAADRKQELAWKRTIADPKASAEARAAAESGLSAGRAGGSSGSNPKMHDLEARAQILFKSGETPTLEAAYARVYNDSVSKKGGNSEDLRYLADNSEDPEVRKWASQELASGVGYGKPARTEDMSKWEKQGGFALKPGADRKLKSSWVQVQ